MTTLWAKLKPHIFSWHMLPCLAMLGAGIGIAVATGRPGTLLPAVACMVMMMVMMAGMGGHSHGSDADDERDR